MPIKFIFFRSELVWTESFVVFILIRCSQGFLEIDFLFETFDSIQSLLLVIFDVRDSF